ncbi:dimethylargininase [Nakamurella deserti]|uniref:dimethylargininase n=1 Tax=Nakamurella deserti TaxID=2164074 RepID=UPI000DBE4C78|nr:dimethylargininase [Nakamurella deserti]
MSAARALVRRPAPHLADGLVTHIERSVVDQALAERQWSDYVEALRAHGFRPVEVDPADDCPDGVFVEDAVVVYADLAVLSRSGAVQRRAELPTVRAAVEAAGLRIAELTAPATLDGGDVLKIGRTVYVGQTLRTNAAAVDQLRALVTPEGWEVVPVPTTRVLHLKSAVTALPDGTVIGCPPLVDDPAVFDTFLAVPEEGGAHVVLLGDDTLLMAASAPRSAEVFRGLGYRTVVVDISEFEKLEGCVTCLSVRLRG